MPIFEYHCASCNKNFEVLVKRNREISCSHCGSAEVTKKISSFAFSVPRNVKTPPCASACSDGFTHGTCGSGLCTGG